MSVILRDLWFLTREIPLEFEERLHTLVTRIHRPQDSGDPIRPACLGHKRPLDWPCDEWVRADEARTAVRERRAALRT